MGEFALGTQTYCVKYQDCLNVTMAQNMNLTQSESVFTNQMWEAQKAVYEKSAGWIFWSWKVRFDDPLAVFVMKLTFVYIDRRRAYLVCRSFVSLHASQP